MGRFPLTPYGEAVKWAVDAEAEIKRLESLLTIARSGLRYARGRLQESKDRRHIDSALKRSDPGTENG